MKNKILLLITIILSGVFIFVSSKCHTTFFMMDDNSQNIVVKDQKNNETQSLKLED